MQKIDQKQNSAKIGVRINKYLKDQGHSTRRGADELIEQGLVTINGKIAKLGDQVNAGDIVEIKNTVSKTEWKYYAYDKPTGIVTTMPQKGEKEIIKITHFPIKVFPVGRLDKDSTGLIIMTNDGRITERLLSPEFEHEKEYVVGVNKPLTDPFLRKMASGVKIGSQKAGYKTKPAIVKPLHTKEFSIILTEGKNRQIRRMCETLGYHVETLKRIRIMNVTLGTLPAGKFRELVGKEKETLLASLLLNK